MTESAPCQQFHLFCEPLESSPLAAAIRTTSPAGPAQRVKLVVPPGPVRLVARRGEPPRLSPVAAEPSASGPVIEATVSRGHQPRLLVISSPDAPLFVNGHAAPRVALLKEKDQFQVDHPASFHLAVFHQPQIGAPPPDAIGKPCPVCLVPFTAESRCYICPCGAALHSEGEPEEQDKLQCARISSECPVCRRPVVLTQGYSFVPDIANE